MAEREPRGTARVVVDGEPLAPVPRRLFGALVEHMGRGVYGGIYEPGHPAADAHGFRTDVLALVRELGISTIRYPGGNFVSGYRWEDGVGPRALRPARLDLAWQVTESNAFGTDEFIAWCRLAGIEPMMALNFGTRGLAEALDLLEYANHPSGTALAGRRIANGAVEPHGIRTWCLGNEMDGPWQLGHQTAAEYARLAAETARGMRMFDRGLELVACGSSGMGMPTFGAWEETVLRETSGLVDAISLHAYYECHDGDLATFLATPGELERFIEAVAAIVDATGAVGPDGSPVWLSVDEWNVWYLAKHLAASVSTGFPAGRRFSEDAYTAADAVAVGGYLVALLKHCDRVRAACIAQLVNTIGVIRAEPDGPAWRTALFHPFALTAEVARDAVVHLVTVDAPVLATAAGGVPALDAVALRRGEAGGSVILVHRDPASSLPVDIRAGVLGGAVRRATVVGGGDPFRSATAADPAGVAPEPLPFEASPGGARVVLPPASWALVEFASAG